VDVTVIVTWQDGQVTRHHIRDLPDLSTEELDELLDKNLVSFLDPGELPTSSEGWALTWVSVRQCKVGR
jgi:hypothetical protein